MLEGRAHGGWPLAAKGRGKPGVEPVYSTATETMAHWHAAVHDLQALDSGSPEARALEVKIDRLQDNYQAIVDGELSWQRRARVGIQR